MIGAGRAPAADHDRRGPRGRPTMIGTGRAGADHDRHNFPEVVPSERYGGNNFPEVVPILRLVWSGVTLIQKSRWIGKPTTPGRSLCTVG
jgi:hypothetical protein